MTHVSDSDETIDEEMRTESATFAEYLAWQREEYGYAAGTHRVRHMPAAILRYMPVDSIMIH